MKNHLLTLLTVCLTASLATTAQAEVTAPVGYVKLTFNANADTPFSLPMDRPKAFAGKVASVAGNVITVENGAFTASDYVYLDGTQNEKYYVLFTTGSLEGRRFDITANTTTTITVDQDGDTTVQALIDDAMATDLFEIRPHWTPNTLFPDGANFPATTNINIPVGQILFRTQSELDASDIGINIALSPTEGFYFFDNGVPANKGWYKTGTDTNAADDILRKNVLYVYRNQSSTQHIVNLVGDVPLVDSSSNVKILSDLMAQDNYMTHKFPVDASLTQLGILNMPGFKVTTGNVNIPNGDIVQLYPQSPAKLNLATVDQYIYYDAPGTADDGWYKLPVVEGAIINDLKIFKPGAGFVIRKASDTKSTNTLQTPLPYTLAE